MSEPIPNCFGRGPHHPQSTLSECYCCQFMERCIYESTKVGRIVARPAADIAIDRWKKLGCRLQARLQRELAAQGDTPDRELLKLQHDLTDLLSTTL